MGRPTISVNILPWEQAQSQAYPIRLAVFVKEQGVPEELELDEEDPLAWHAIAKLDGKQLVPHAYKKMERLAGWQ